MLELLERQERLTLNQMEADFRSGPRRRARFAGLFLAELRVGCRQRLERGRVAHYWAPPTQHRIFGSVAWAKPGTVATASPLQ
jgi:hypothetical protein